MALSIGAKNGWISQFENHNTDGSGPVVNQATGQQVRCVAEFAGGREDAIPSCRSNQITLGEDTRCGDWRDAGAFGLRRRV